MSVASMRRASRYPTPTTLDSAARRVSRRRHTLQPRLLDSRLEDRTLLTFTPITQPSAAYIANTDLIPITVANGATLTSITDGTETVAFSATMTAATTTTGGFNNWGSPPDVESNSTRVLFNAAAQTLTLTFSQPVATFGIELQQDTFSTDALSVQFLHGATTVGTLTRSITVPGAPVGSAANGAKLFAASTNLNSEAFTSVVITGPTTHGFGIAQIRYAVPSADLSVTKAGPTTVGAGNNITYTLTAGNAGPVDAANVVLSDALPAGATFVSATAPAGWSLTTPAVGSGGTVFATLPSFASGGSATFTIVAQVASTTANGTVLSNTGNISSTTADRNGGNNSATATTTVSASADVAITKVGPATASAGSNITYTITVANNGPSDAQGYSTTDTPPAGTTVVAFFQTSGPANGGTLPSGATATFQLVLTAGASLPTGTVLTNQANVSSTTPDPNPGNNTSSVTTTIITSADLAVTKVASPSPVTPGSALTYTITLSNNGPSDAQAVSLTDGIPAGTTFVSATAPAGWTTTAPAVGGTGTVTFARASFAAGASRTFTIVVQVVSNFAAPAVSNTASVSSTTPDPDTGNNSFTTNTPVSTPVDLVVTKTGSPNPVVAGANLTYTVTVQNTGSLPAVNVKLYDILPDRTTFVSNSGAPGWTTTNPPVGSGGIITSTIPSFAGGATANFIIVVQVAGDARPGNILTNRAVVTTSSSETNTNNNSTTFSVTVAAPPPAAVAKAAAVTTTNSGGTTTKSVAPNPAITAKDLAIALSSGLVADILRQKTLSGLFSFGG